MIEQLPLPRYYIGEWFEYPKVIPSPTLNSPDEFTAYLIYDSVNKKVLRDSWNNLHKEWNSYGSWVTHWTPYPHPPILNKKQD